ncbi:Uncharacterised protein [Mycobacteroides abscessus subsp. abscessus]|nr:Uncharacterised protein [Mycobacteroides abscessus subsp. abscessus]
MVAPVPAVSAPSAEISAVRIRIAESSCRTPAESALINAATPL